jgi:hypothetical protein
MFGTQNGSFHMTEVNFPMTDQDLKFSLLNLKLMLGEYMKMPATSSFPTSFRRGMIPENYLPESTCKI